MATCNNVTLIFDSECIGESLIKINTNFTNLDAGLCQLGKDLLSLDAFVKSLSAKDSPTVDMTFSSNPYYLQADVVDNSLGTVKLGIDIPTSTKQFLTAAKIQSLIDTTITNPQSGELLIWNGASWINQEIVDQAGAKFLNELEDVTITSPTQNQILKYNSSTNQWVNGTDESELTVRDGDYEDIKVTGNGKIWNIRPGKVGTDEIATNAVTTSKIANLAVVNDKIANATITKSKLAFTPGEINTGTNIGNGTDICAGPNVGTQIPIRRITGAGAVSITSTADTITISVPNTPGQAMATGANVGTGTGVYSVSQSTPGNLKFKTLKAGTGIAIQDGTDEVTISAITNLGLSIIGVGPTGAQLTNEEIAQRINLIYPATSFDEGTTCKVEVTVPEVSPITSVNVSIPYSIRYYKRGCNFILQTPDGSQNATEFYPDYFRINTTLNGTGTPSNQPFFRVPTRTIKTFVCFRTTIISGWAFLS